MYVKFVVGLYRCSVWYKWLRSAEIHAVESVAAPCHTSKCNWTVYNFKPLWYPVNKNEYEIRASVVNTLSMYSQRVQFVTVMWCRSQAKGGNDVLLMVEKVWEWLRFKEKGSGVWLLCSKSQPVLFEPVNVVTEFECRSQLQSQVLHHHLTFQQEQSISIYLLEHTTELC